MHKNKKLLSLLLIALLSIAIIGGTASASGTPTKVFAFTDKKTYMGWWYQTQKSGTVLTQQTDLAANLRIIVYAVVLDDDGNIMTGRAGSLSGRANETQRLKPGGAAGHHTVINYPNVFGNFTLNFVDDGSIPEDTANDGIYTAIADLDDTKGAALIADHIKYNISVTDTAAGTQYTEVLITGLTCMKTSIPTDHSSATHIDATHSDDCAVCHHGYEHWYENKSGTFRDDELDIHAFKTGGIDVSAPSAQVKIFSGNRWNYSDDAGSGATTWDAQVPGSKYCAMCHMKFTDQTYGTVSSIFDYGSGDRTNSSDIPSCNDSSCHKSGRTLFENTTIPSWSPGAMGQVKVGSNENITQAKAHNRTATRVPCALCHGTTHGFNLPNTTKNVTQSPINEQCWLCHNITGGLNITSNGGSNVPHTSTDCKSCHNDASGSLNVHVVPQGEAGNDCIGCHTSQQGIFPPINLTSFTRHKNVNATGGLNILTNDDCTTCHYNTSGMGTGYRSLPGVNLYTCENCHTQGNYSAPIISNHRPPKQLPPVAGGNITTNAYCSDCHNNSINQFAYSINASVGHYGTNDTLLKPTVNQTSRPRFGFMNLGDASAYNKECNNCHNPSNATWGNPTLITTPHTSLGTCKECHVNGNASDLHNGSLSLPQTFSCLDCHTTYAAKYNAPNITNTAMPGFGTCDSGCHGAGNGNGTLDPSEHNTDRNYAGTPGSADTVLLNNQTSLTVPRGASVTVTSKVNDAAGGASRVGGAEYYIDTDPGMGKGIPMDAADGQYDAVNGAWENVTGTIDTSTLSDGNHTIYVRGMDIGKQWSGSQSASLTVQSIGYINGTVTSSGSPVARAIVSTTGASYTTASDGNYSLIVPAGTYNVTASKQPAYNDSTANGVVVTPNNTTIQNLVLTLKPTGTIKGTVSTS